MLLLYQFSYVKIFSTHQDGNLVLLDDPGRVRSQITSVVCQIQRFDFDCNLVVKRKVIIRIPPGLGLNPLYLLSVKYAATVARAARTRIKKTVKKKTLLAANGRAKFARCELLNFVPWVERSDLIYKVDQIDAPK
jgi:hypothetical protein